MTMTKNRTFGILVISAAFIGAMAVSADAWAKPKKKAKDKEKAAEKTVVPDTTQQSAREHYSKGKALYDEGKFAESLVEFTAAYNAKPHPTVLKSIAECQVQVGDTLAAIQTLEKYLETPETADKESVEKRIQELKTAPVKVSLSSVPDGAKIFVAGKEMKSVTPTEIELTPGEHVVTFTVDGYEPLSKSVTVVLGEQNQLGADFAAEATPAAAEPAPAVVNPLADRELSPPAPEAKEQSGPPTAFWAMAAVTGVGLISGTVFGTMALSVEDDYKDDPTQEKKEAGQRDALIADVSFGVAAAAAIAGTVLLVVHHKKSKSSESAALTVVPAAGPKDIGFSAVIEF